jgi:hypothetical protein
MNAITRTLQLAHGVDRPGSRAPFTHVTHEES